VGQATANGSIFGEGEYLSFVLEPSEGTGVDDAGAVTSSFLIDVALLF
jgi:hypothetical protein